MIGLDKKSDVVVIGGVACGPKAAATLMRRLPNAEVTLFQKEKRLSYGSCGMPYFASGDVGSFAELMQTSYGVVRDTEYFEKTRLFTAVTSTEVLSINRDSKSVTVKLHDKQQTIEHGYDKLVIATGAVPKRAPFPIPECDTVRSFTRPEDAIHFRKMAETGQVSSVAIVGGGFIGCELAEAAASLWGMETTLVEREPQILPFALDPEMAALAQAEMQKQSVTVHTSVSVEKIEQSETGLDITLDNGNSLTVDYVFLCLGVNPMINLAEAAGLEIGETGGIAVNEQMQTSDPDIFAGGDCVQSTHQLDGHKLFLPLGSLANRHGRVIAENLAGNPCGFPGVLGAFFVKIFDMNIGSVGFSMDAARDAARRNSDINPACVWGTFGDKPEFYPESSTLVAKMVYDKSSGQLLGLQVVGEGDICRRVDVFSSYLSSKSDLTALINHEHGYAPPYSEAMDPLHHLAAIAQAEQRGYDQICPQFCYDSGNIPAGAVLLDVRLADEFQTEPSVENGKFDKIINIQLEQLIDRLDELNKSVPVVVICKRGPRSYQAAVILKKYGFENVRVVAAGVSAQIIDDHEQAE